MTGPHVRPRRLLLIFTWRTTPTYLITDGAIGTEGWIVFFQKGNRKGTPGNATTIRVVRVRGGGIWWRWFGLFVGRGVLLDIIAAWLVALACVPTAFVVRRREWCRCVRIVLGIIMDA